jgi:hypothetical protein
MHCPFCGEESFAKKKLIYSGWQITGELEVCALCGKELPAAEKKNDAAAGAAAERKRKLSALLGGVDTGTVQLAGEADRKFCRNCRNFVVHPFRNFCALTDAEADPMGECEQFTAKELR